MSLFEGFKPKGDKTCLSKGTGSAVYVEEHHLLNLDQGPNIESEITQIAPRRHDGDDDYHDYDFL